MPTLTFTSPAATPMEMTLLMMYPADETLRARGYALAEMDRLTRDPSGEPLVLKRQHVRLLLEAPPLSAIREEQVQRTRQGFLAGRLLATIYLCDRFKDSHHYFVPSMNRALHVCMHQGASGSKFGDGSPLPRSDKTIRDAWRSFASVAHYWAAASMGSLGYPFAPERQLFAPKWFDQFLGVSAALHRFGTTFVPLGASPPVPLMDATKTWLTPPGVVPAELKSNRPPDILKSILQKYRAPK